MKYHNNPTVFDGIRFVSKAEAKRYQQLILMEKAALIQELRIQPKFKLEVGGAQICTYIGDFSYFENATEKAVVEDVKGFETREFRLKAKLFRVLYPDYELRVIK